MTAEAAIVSDFSYLPEVSFAEINAGTLEEMFIQTAEHYLERTLFPGDPVRILCTTFAILATQLNVTIDKAAKQNLLRYAEKAFLDHIGAQFDCKRLDASKAETRMEFFLAAGRVDYDVVIPLGTRVTPGDGKIFFQTTERAVIPTGEHAVSIMVEATAAGTAANGLIPGQVNRLVDPKPAGVKVTNLKTTTGGADVEDDERYRQRIHLAPERFSTAGPTNGYIYWALSARSDIEDVEVYSPTPGVVEVYILLQGGRVPEADGPEIADVMAVLSDAKVRPLTDCVRVLPAVAVDFDYRFTYYLYDSQAGFVDMLANSVKNVAEAYEAWQSGKIGRDINPDELKRACRAAGLKRIVAERVWRDENGEVIKAEPMTFVELARNEIARIPYAADRVTFGGIEDE